MSNVAFWVVLAAIAFAEAAIVVAALRIPIASAPDRGIVGARPMETVWTLLPALLLVAVAVLSFGALDDGDALDGSESEDTSRTLSAAGTMAADPRTEARKRHWE